MCDAVLICRLAFYGRPKPSFFHDSVVVVVHSPAVNPPTDFRQAQEQLLIQEFVMKFAGRRLDMIIFPRVPLAMNSVLISAIWSQQRTVFATNAGRIPPDLPPRGEIRLPGDLKLFADLTHLGALAKKHIRMT